MVGSCSPFHKCYVGGYGKFFLRLSFDNVSQSRLTESLDGPRHESEVMKNIFMEVFLSALAQELQMGNSRQFARIFLEARTYLRTIDHRFRSRDLAMQKEAGNAFIRTERARQRDMGEFL